MKRRSVGLVDYGVGNLASLSNCLSSLDYNVKISKDCKQLDALDMLILPGVGAFPVAINALKESSLDNFIVEKTIHGKPLIGICLGMQLLATASDEFGAGDGLNLIPGRVEKLQSGRPNIGWNYVHPVGDGATPLTFSRHFYFNHSFHFKAPPCCTVGLTNHDESLVSAIVRDNIIGFQFHPEKSQAAGKALLKQALEYLVNA